MKLIEPSIEIIKETDPFKKIEIIGRVCYKSENNISENSAIKFYKNLIKNEHFAMIEHANYVFDVDDYTYREAATKKYLNCTKQYIGGGSRYIVSGNLRAINESGVPGLLYALNNINSDLLYSKSLAEKNDYIKVIDNANYDNKINNIHKYLSAKFICDLGVSHEIVRHRPASYAQESTRYCNYGKNKYGNELTFIKPCFWTEETAGSKYYSKLINIFQIIEETYLSYISDGVSPQEARSVLPKALKTELVMTASFEEFRHFFKLRCDHAAHPQMREVAFTLLRLVKKLYPGSFDDMFPDVI